MFIDRKSETLPKRYRFTAEKSLFKLIFSGDEMAVVYFHLRIYRLIFVLGIKGEMKHSVESAKLHSLFLQHARAVVVRSVASCFRKRHFQIKMTMMPMCMVSQSQTVPVFCCWKCFRTKLNMNHSGIIVIFPWDAQNGALQFPILFIVAYNSRMITIQCSRVCRQRQQHQH